MEEDKVALEALQLIHDYCWGRECEDCIFFRRDVESEGFCRTVKTF